MNIKTIFAAALLAILPLSANAVTVTNGSFEMDPGSVGIVNGNNFASMVGATGSNSWDGWAGLPGWRETGHGGLELQTARTVSLTPFKGNYYLELDGTRNTNMKQSLVFDRIGEYKLTFAYAPRSKNPLTNGIYFGIKGKRGTQDLLSEVRVSGPNSQNPLMQWTTVTTRFFVGSIGRQDLYFGARGLSDSYGGFIDDVQISAVPIPAAGLMLITALGGLGFSRRRKKA